MTTASCIGCGRPRKDQDVLESRRIPCPRCGARGLAIEVQASDGIQVYDDFAYKQKRGAKALMQGKVGMEFHHDSGTWQRRERHINNANPHDDHSYTELIVNKSLGIVISKDEKLSQHWGHGSAKNPRT